MENFEVIYSGDYKAKNILMQHFTMRYIFRKTTMTIWSMD